MESDFSALGISVGALGIALSHAALPTHWLPFVLVGKAHNWSRQRILVTAVGAGTGHVFMTIALGLLTGLLGAWISEAGKVIGELLSAGLLVGTGAFLLLRDVIGSEHHHVHESRGTARTSTLSLFLMLTLSPCEAMIPVFFAAGNKGVGVLVLLSAIMAIGTVAGMAVLILLTFAGLQYARFEFLERHECTVMGGLLVAMGIIVGGMWLL